MRTASKNIELGAINNEKCIDDGFRSCPFSQIKVGCCAIFGNKKLKTDKYYDRPSMYIRLDECKENELKGGAK